MKKQIIIILGVLTIFTGCVMFDVTPRVETVIDRHYVPKECPKFTHKLVIDGNRYMGNNDVSQTTVITPLDSFVESLERNKLAREEFNNVIVESNKPHIVLGEPETSNFKRVTKRIFINRDCPKYTYKPNIPAKKLKNDFKAYTNTTYVVITLDEMLTKLEKNKMVRETYNEGIEDINEKSFVDSMKNKFDDVVEVTVEKIDDTAATIKKFVADKTKEYAKNKVK